MVIHTKNDYIHVDLGREELIRLALEMLQQASATDKDFVMGGTPTVFMTEDIRGSEGIEFMKGIRFRRVKAIRRSDYV